MAEPPAIAVRPDLKGLDPYRSPQRPARFMLNTNESPYPPPESVVDAIGGVLETLNRYPDHSASLLYESLGRLTGVEEGAIWIANGSNEVFLHLFLAFGGPERRLVAFEPTYSMHSKIARITGTKVLQGTREHDWEIAGDELSRMLDERPDICVFCSPNNPTGNLESRTTVEFALRSVPLVVVDEAYVEFSRSEGMLDLLADHPNLVIVRTLSKAWRLAGGRLGYALGAPELLDELQRVALPYGLSTMSQAMGREVLARADEALEHVEAIVSERERLISGMRSLGLDPWPSSANFVLVPFGSRTAPDPIAAGRVWDGLLERGVLVRDYDEDGALGGHLRVTAGTPEETDAFLQALEEVLGD